MLTTFYPPFNFGGDGIGVQRLSRALVRRGYEVTVVHDVDAFASLSDEAPPDAATVADGVEVVALRSGLGVVSPLLVQQLGRPVLNAPRIARLLAERRFDILHFNNVSLIGGPGLLGYGGDTVKVYEAHEHWLVCPSHVLWRHGREPCVERQCLRCVLRHKRPPQAWRYTGHLERNLDHIDLFIAKSEFSRRKHEEFGFTRAMDVLPYFLPDSPAPVVQQDRPQERPYFLFVGRLERIKGLDDVIPVFARYGAADLLIAGTGEYEAELRRQAAGIAGVRFLGRLPADELSKYYQHAEALIVPSVCFETFGVILIEAFRQRTPVLARRIGPFPEIVEQSGGGLLFGTADELERGMARMQNDPAERDRFAAAGQQAFDRLWSESAVLPRYLELVGQAAERRGRQDLLERLNQRSAA